MSCEMSVKLPDFDSFCLLGPMLRRGLAFYPMRRGHNFIMADCGEQLFATQKYNNCSGLEGGIDLEKSKTGGCGGLDICSCSIC